MCESYIFSSFTDIFSRLLENYYLPIIFYDVYLKLRHTFHVKNSEIVFNLKWTENTPFRGESKFTTHFSDTVHSWRFKSVANIHTIGSISRIVMILTLAILPKYTSNKSTFINDNRISFKRKLDISLWNALRMSVIHSLFTDRVLSKCEKRTVTIRAEGAKRHGRSHECWKLCASQSSAGPVNCPSVTCLAAPASFEAFGGAIKYRGKKIVHMNDVGHTLGCLNIIYPTNSCYWQLLWHVAQSIFPASLLQ